MFNHFDHQATKLGPRERSARAGPSCMRAGPARRFGQSWARAKTPIAAPLVVECKQYEEDPCPPAQGPLSNELEISRDHIIAPANE